MPIELWHGLQQGPVLHTFNEIVLDWNAAHPDMPVKTKEYTVFDAPAKEALAQTAGPNLVLAPEYMTSALMAAFQEKKIVPINRLLDAGPLDRIAEIVKRTFGNAKGELVSLPFNPACGVLYANASLVEKLPTSLEELEQISLKLMKEGKTKGGYTCAWPAAYLVEVPAAQQNLPLALPANGQFGYGAYCLNSPWLRDHLLDLRRLQAAGVFVYAGQTNEARKPFVEGEVAFFLQGSTHLPILQKEAAFPIAVAPLPTLTRGQTVQYAFPLGGASVWVLDNASTQAQFAAIQHFVEYLASEPIQEKWHKETAYVPVLKDLPQKLSAFYETHPVHRAVVRQTLEAPLGDYSFGIHMPNYSQARRELFLLLEKVLNPDTPDREVSRLLQHFDETFTSSPPLR